MNCGFCFDKHQNWMDVIGKHLTFAKNEGSGFYTRFKLPEAIDESLKESLKESFKVHVTAFMYDADYWQLLYDINAIIKTQDSTCGVVVDDFNNLYIKICFALVIYHADNNTKIERVRLQNLLELYL